MLVEWSPREREERWRVVLVCPYIPEPGTRVIPRQEEEEKQDDGSSKKKKEEKTLQKRRKKGRRKKRKTRRKRKRKRRNERGEWVRQEAPDKRWFSTARGPRLLLCFGFVSRVFLFPFVVIYQEIVFSLFLSRFLFLLLCHFGKSLRPLRILSHLDFF